MTIALQNLRTFCRDEFDAWYAPKEAEMRANPRFRYLNELRNQVLKQGTYGATRSVGVQIMSLNTLDIARLPKPPNAESFFIGDELGGSGWLIRMADGSLQKFYAQLPAATKIRALTGFASTTTEKGITPPAVPIDNLFVEYLNYLHSVLSEAERVFGRS